MLFNSPSSSTAKKSSWFQRIFIGMKRRVDISLQESDSVPAVAGHSGDSANKNKKKWAKLRERKRAQKKMEFLRRSHGAGDAGDTNSSRSTSHDHDGEELSYKYVNAEQFPDSTVGAEPDLPEAEREVCVVKADVHPIDNNVEEPTLDEPNVSDNIVGSEDVRMSGTPEDSEHQHAIPTEPGTDEPLPTENDDEASMLSTTLVLSEDVVVTHTHASKQDDEESLFMQLQMLSPSELERELNSLGLGNMLAEHERGQEKSTSPATEAASPATEAEQETQAEPKESFFADFILNSIICAVATFYVVDADEGRKAQHLCPLRSIKLGSLDADPSRVAIVWIMVVLMLTLIRRMLVSAVTYVRNLIPFTVFTERRFRQFLDALLTIYVYDTMSYLLIDEGFVDFEDFKEHAKRLFISAEYATDGTN